MSTVIVDEICKCPVCDHDDVTIELHEDYVDIGCMNCGYGGNWSDKSESDFIEVIDNKDAKINELLLKVKKSDETVRQMRYWAKKIRETI